MFSAHSWTQSEEKRYWPRKKRHRNIQVPPDPARRGRKIKWPERTVSRVLYPAAVACCEATIIPLGPPLPMASSSLTRESRTGRPQSLPYLALLRMGFTELPTSPPALVSSCLTLSPLPRHGQALAGGLLSVALSLGSPPVPVKDHPALWSPDFPPPAFAKATAGGDRLVLSNHLPVFVISPVR